MKETFLMLWLFLVCAIPVQLFANEKVKQRQNQQKECVEVLYFHSKQRCATCIAIEANIQKVLQQYFANELENGTVLFRAIDLSSKENEAVAGKYEVAFSSLLLVHHMGSAEQVENMTPFAFKNARKAPETFSEGLVKKINELLK